METPPLNAENTLENEQSAQKNEEEILGTGMKNIETDTMLETSYILETRKKPSNQHGDPLTFLNIKFTKADDSFVLGSTCMYWKAELAIDMPDLSFKGSTIIRPAGLILRPGDEIFVSSPKRPAACNKTFIIFGLFPDCKNPNYSYVLMIDEEYASGQSELDQIFRASPLQYIGLVPNGRCIDSTKALLNSLAPLLRQLFNKLFNENKASSLASLDL